MDYPIYTQLLDIWFVNLSISQPDQFIECRLFFQADEIELNWQVNTSSLATQFSSESFFSCRKDS